MAWPNAPRPVAQRFIQNSHCSSAKPRGIISSSGNAATQPTLSPRQRKLAAKRRQRQQQPHDPVYHQQGHKQQQQQQQQQLSQLPCHGVQNQTLAAQQQIGVTQDWDQPGCQQDTLVAQLLAHLQQHQQQQHDLGVLEQQLQLLDTQHLTQLILLHAAHARSMHTQQQLSAAQGGISALASEAHVKMKQLTRQQLADIAYGLAHWDVLQWHCQQQQQQQDVGLLPQHATQQVLPAFQEIHDDRCCHGRQQWLEQQQQRCPPLNLQYSSCFQQELKVPFLVLPNLFPCLHLDDFMKELSLKSDIIRLTDESGAVREVNESRMTDWQSDVGATFCYSGKEMVPTGEGLTAQIAQVRDILADALGEVYDSVLINFYMDGKCGMRFHADPLYGCWAPATAVVSVGATRQFVFRTTADHSTRWSYRVSSGDVVMMFGDCQDRLQHAVKVEATADAVGPRLSLVYKQRIPS